MKGIAVAAGIVAVLVVLGIAYGPIGVFFEHLVSESLNAFAKTLHGGVALRGPRLYAVAFGGGLLASISPCILGLLPLNLSYIGASKPQSRASAMRLATIFVGGVAVTTMAVGLVSSLFFAVFVSYRAQVNITVGVVVVLMALWMGGVVRLPLPSAIKTIPTGGGPFVVGLVYALVASPCASPVLIAVLGAAAGAGSIAVSVAAMAFYAVGYTTVLWLASVFAGIALASRKLLAYGDLITRIGAAALLLLGVGTIVYGFTQF